MQNYIYKAKVNRVVDGDTIDLEVDLGFSIKVNHRFRMIGYDAPETYRPKTEAEKEAGKKVTDFLTNLLDEVKDSLYVESKKLGIYGRYEGELHYCKDSTQISVNKAVLAYMEQEKLTKEAISEGQ